MSDSQDEDKHGHKEVPPDHVMTTKGAIHQSNLTTQHKYHARQVAGEHSHFTKHTEYRDATGELVRRDVHVGCSSEEAIAALMKKEEKQ